MNPNSFRKFVLVLFVDLGISHSVIQVLLTMVVRLPVNIFVLNWHENPAHRKLVN